MAAQIRPATIQDAPLWLDLARAVLGPEFPSKKIYDPAWVAEQLDPSTGHETWVAEVDGALQGSISLLKSSGMPDNPVDNLGRNLHRPESFKNGSAEALVRAVAGHSATQKRMAVARIPASDNAQQILYENLGFSCVGFQPYKHMLQARTGMLFYVKAAAPVLGTRLSISESLPQVSELAAIAFDRLKISNPLIVRDGVTGYPLQSELKVHDATHDDFDLWRAQAEASNPPTEISGNFNLGLGLLRMESREPIRAVLGQRGDKIVAGLAYYYDEQDRCARFVAAFASDDLSTGALLQHALKLVQDQFNAVYVEIDILASAPRLIKTAEQLGFVPVAYLPAFYCKQGSYADVVKMVKLNMAYSLDDGGFTAEARAVVEVIDHNFKDQKVGVAIINLLRGLPIFEGLGDGELRKIARLFVQKLYRPGEIIFRRGDFGNEAYVVMRGQVDIQLEEATKPIATIPSGKIFGELAFLDGAPRNAFAIANQASILLVVQRTALNDLVHREPHLGMVVMRNVAMDLSNKLRQANTALASLRK